MPGVRSSRSTPARQPGPRHAGAFARLHRLSVLPKLEPEGFRKAAVSHPLQSQETSSAEAKTNTAIPEKTSKMFTSDLTRRQRAWPGAACVALSARRRGLTRRLCDRGAAQAQRAAAGRAVGGRRVNPSPASGRRFHDAKPQARRAGEERQVLDGAHGREPPVEAAPGRAPASLNTLSRADRRSGGHGWC